MRDPPLFFPHEQASVGGAGHDGCRTGHKDRHCQANRAGFEGADAAQRPDGLEALGGVLVNLGVKDFRLGTNKVPMTTRELLQRVINM